MLQGSTKLPRPTTTHAITSATTQVAQKKPEQKAPLESLLHDIHQRRWRRGLLTMVVANFESAVEALRANFMRSLLTVLGIFIGVAAVIGALTLTQGTNAYVNNQVASLGDSILIAPGTAESQGASQGSGTLSTLTFQDAQAVAALPHVLTESPFIDTTAQVVYGNQNWNTTIEGVNIQVQTMQNWKVAQGSWFSSNDDELGNPVAVLGDTVYHSLFDTSGDNPLGKQIRIGAETFRVVGVLAPQGGGFTQDDVIFVPIKAAQVRLNETTTVNQIQVQVDDPANVNRVSQEITTLLRQRHHISAGQTDDFQVTTFTFVLQRIGQTTQILTFLLVGIAAISLTVGGIGIMNIMLVSVTERTWEIGIRMAIGARRGDIRNQFLIESLLLCLIGGIMGLGFGLLIGWMVTYVAKLPFIVTVISLTLPFVVAGSVAVIFGLYPAIRASRLDPIVAIRSEE
jgi:putative ABC transport system permease protein